MKLKLAILVLLLSQPLWAVPELPKWPAGPGRDLVKTNCTICHSSDMIAGQRLSSDTWAKEVDKMAGWGSPIPKDQKAKLVEYLTTHFGADQPDPELRIGSGDAAK